MPGKRERNLLVAARGPGGEVEYAPTPVPIDERVRSLAADAETGN